MLATPIFTGYHGGAVWTGRQFSPSLHLPIPRVLLKLSVGEWKCRLINSRSRIGNLQTGYGKGSFRANFGASSDWDTRHSEVYDNGERYYLDEQDIVTFLDPPKQLIPLDPSSFNPASYIWKKIDDIPEERRHHLLSLLDARLISRAWEVGGSRYDDPKLAKKSASRLLSGEDGAGCLELWNIRTTGAPFSISWIHSSQKAIFCCSDGKVYGRFIGGYNLTGLLRLKSPSPLPVYFSVKEVNEVMATEQPCDFAYEFGDGVPDLPEYPAEFPKPAKLPWPLSDQVVVYIRHLGPGVMVGQAWQEGRALEQVPKKLCNEVLMVRQSA